MDANDVRLALAEEIARQRCLFSHINEQKIEFDCNEKKDLRQYQQQLEREIEGGVALSPPACKCGMPAIMYNVLKNKSAQQMFQQIMGQNGD